MTTDPTLRLENLAETLAELQQRVRSQPSDAKHRIFLFQLLSVLGEWPRALNQLEVIGELDASALAMVQTYREAIRCEVLRAEVFAGRKTPVIFGQPEEWLGLAIEALRLNGEGRHDSAAELRARAFEAAPASRGTTSLTGRGSGREADDATPPRTFEWIADADSRLGPVLEAIVNGRYFWVPFQRIARVDFEAPTDLRDLVWAPAHFTWSNGGESVGLIPARYPESEKAEDDAIRLSRRTTWTEIVSGTWFGLGQRVLATDSGEDPLLVIRSIELESAPTGGGEPGGG